MRNCDCQYELIYQIVNGCVYQNGHGVIYLEYGNLSITFSKNAFDEFATFINDFDIKNAHDFLRPPNNKIIIQPSKSPNSYAFSLSEMKELKILLKNAKNVLYCLEEAKSLLK